jgi:hypothetical protein
MHHHASIERLRLGKLDVADPNMACHPRNTSSSSNTFLMCREIEGIATAVSPKEHRDFRRSNRHP